MIVEFLEEAVEELLDAALWYESKDVGLGVRFRDEIARVVIVLPRIFCCGESVPVGTGV